MQSEPKSQGRAVAFHVSGLLVALEGHLLCTERPQVWQAEKRKGTLFTRPTVPFQSLFDYVSCDVDGLLQFSFSLRKWLEAGHTFWSLLIPEVTLLSPEV